VAERAGGIDVAFNAVGLGDVQGIALLDMPIDDFMHPILVGARMQLLTARAVARHMVAQGAGVLLTITAGPPEATPYVGGFAPACGAINPSGRAWPSSDPRAFGASACTRPGRPAAGPAGDVPAAREGDGANGEVADSAAPCDGFCRSSPGRGRGDDDGVGPRPRHDGTLSVTCGSRGGWASSTAPRQLSGRNANRCQRRLWPRSNGGASQVGRRASA
jgi:hypothetical protein